MDVKGRDGGFMPPVTLQPDESEVGIKMGIPVGTTHRRLGGPFMFARAKAQ
jgi:hypothetical protein